MHRVRVKRAMTDTKKKSLVLASLRTGAIELEEVAEDCDFTPDETLRVLELLVEEKKVRKEGRDGVMKFWYFLDSI